MVYQLNCLVCGREFTARRCDSVCCSDECRRRRNAEYQRKYQTGLKRKKKQKKRLSAHRAAPSLFEELARLEQYNEEHGTCLKYGEWMAGIRRRRF